MPNVAIVTDSVASIPEALLKELNIQSVAYYLHRGQEVLRDLVTVQRDEFLRWLETAKTLPSTASPGPGDYFSVFQHLVEQGAREIVSLQMTSDGSGAFQAAKVAQSMALEQWPDARIEVIDTRNVALCQGWMVIEAARAALAGGCLDDVVGRVKQMIPVTRMIQTADTLKYLYMGGRIGLAQRVV
jgi:DegV family protein with EDD domain